MVRMLCTLGAIALSGTMALALSGAPLEAPTGEVEVVGRERPLNLGGVTVTASALPD